MQAKDKLERINKIRSDDHEMHLFCQALSLEDYFTLRILPMYSIVTLFRLLEEQ